MISGKEIGEILVLYAKHGWTLRRVLLSDNLHETLPDDLFGEAKILSSKLNALWFSRASKFGEAWEIRRLSNTPFALVAVFPAETDEKEREKRLDDLQTDLINRTSK